MLSWTMSLYYVLSAVTWKSLLFFKKLFDLFQSWKELNILPALHANWQIQIRATAKYMKEPQLALPKRHIT